MIGPSYIFKLDSESHQEYKNYSFKSDVWLQLGKANISQLKAPNWAGYPNLKLTHFIFWNHINRVNNPNNDFKITLLEV